jgi:hypothetical protein
LIRIIDIEKSEKEKSFEINFRVMQKVSQLSKEIIVLDVFSEDCENVLNWFVITNELYVCHRLLSCYINCVKDESGTQFNIFASFPFKKRILNKNILCKKMKKT